MNRLKGTQGTIGVKVRPQTGKNAEQFPLYSTPSQSYRGFIGNQANAKRMLEYLDKHTDGSIEEPLLKAFKNQEKQHNINGTNEFQTYAVPAFGGREHCATFAGKTMSSYMDLHWVELFGNSPATMHPQNLMDGSGLWPWFNNKSFPQKK